MFFGPDGSRDGKDSSPPRKGNNLAFCLFATPASGSGLNLMRAGNTPAAINQFRIQGDGRKHNFQQIFRRAGGLHYLQKKINSSEQQAAGACFGSSLRPRLIPIFPVRFRRSRVL
jgi:hypothetical protein